jgi:quercetin dioxygenase-like cupin family protein
MTMDGTESSGARIVLSPDEGEMVVMGGLGVRFMVEGDQSGGGFALVEHPIAPRVLAAPMHTHEHEDEYTYVLEGEIGVQVGEEVRVATPGDLVFKPRGIPHAFWNAGDEPARALEIISPAGFERYFAEISPLLPPNHQGPPDEQALGAVMARYGLEMDFASIPALVERHGLVGGEAPA